MNAQTGNAKRQGIKRRWKQRSPHQKASQRETNSKTETMIEIELAMNKM